MASSRLIEAIAATAELCGKVFSPTAARILADDLSAYPEAEVLRALNRCRKELQSGSAFTLGAIIARIDDGRPGAEEAWAMLPRDESQTAIWTEEMRNAWGVALPLIVAGEMVPARMAFREAYMRELTHAREMNRPAVWSVTPGYNAAERERVVRDAFANGRISMATATLFLPSPPPTDEGVKTLSKARVLALKSGGRA